MKRIVCLALALTTILSVAGTAQADFRSMFYGGFQPFFNPFGWGKKHCQTPEERRLQRFWHDYYDAQRRYYKSLEHLDWVTYYKNHGTPTSGGIGGGYGGCQTPAPVQFAPVAVQPTMSWAVPGGGCTPGNCPHGAGAAGHAQAGYPGYPGYGAPPMAMGGYPGYGAPAPGYGMMPYGMPNMPMSAPVAPTGYYYNP